MSGDTQTRSEGAAACEGDVALACMSLLVDALVALGMEHACVSPGSRSTPIALALARDPHVRVHVHLDERSSAFFAAGVAKATGMPVAVACTSGTAAANLFPAIVEASASRVPLIVLTADRPPELRGVGANQTIDQLDLYGRFVRWFVDAPVPSREGAAGWVEVASEAYRRACTPGPVHVNLPFREPLVPTGAGFEFPCVARTFERMEVPPGPPPTEEQVSALQQAVRGIERGLVYAGGLRVAAPPVAWLADRIGWPLISEPHSGLRVPGALSVGQLLLADECFASAHVPDVLLQFGAAPTSRAALTLAAKARRLFIVDPDDVVGDPNRRAELRVVADASATAVAVGEGIEARAGTGWWQGWQEADAAARAAACTLLDSWDEPFGGRIARDLAAALPEESVLVVGSSLPVRDLDTYMLPRGGVRVLANRGASGIDGFVSTVLGVATSGAPTFALCGDLTLLHDAGSLLWSAQRGYQAVFAVVNNDGGGIFSLLPQRELPEFERLFATPHGLDLGRLAAAANAGHAQVERASDLAPAVEGASTAGGVWIIEVTSDRERNAFRHRQVQRAVAVALAHG
ncbi:MAG: 2-succinyl-5-enolpyruvyl-6-hydroxy-3-cyclohexene-1-carboxylic-acid synthase [Actinomycetota bacterium]